MIFRYPVDRGSRPSSLSNLPIPGKRRRSQSRDFSLDSTASTPQSNKARLPAVQLFLCFCLIGYIFLPSHTIKHIGSKASKISNSVSSIGRESILPSISSAFSATFSNRNEEADSKGVAIVAACMNRQQTLANVLPTWREVEGVDEIIIVDWSSNPPLKSIVEAQNDPRIKLVQVLSEKSWVLSRAYNLAVNHTRKEYIIRTDCDYSLKNSILDAHDLNETNDGFFAGNWNLARDSNEVHLNGAMIFKRDMFVRVGGYDERIQTYGWDDEDLYTRLASKKYEKLNVSYDHVSHVQHDDKKRTQAGVKYAQVQIDLNQLLLEKLPVWSRKDAEKRASTYTIVSGAGTNFLEVRASFVPKSLQKRVAKAQLEKSWALALGRRLADDYHVPWDILEPLQAKKREILLRSMMSLQSALDVANANGDNDAFSEEDIEEKQRVLSSMNLEIPPKDARLLVIHAMHGLGNRLRALGSALSYAASTARVPLLIWESDAHIAAEYEALFEPSNLTVLTTFKPSWPLRGLEKWDSSWSYFNFFNYMEMEEGAKKGELVVNDPEKHIYYKGAYIMEAPRHTSWEVDNEKIRALRPVRSVLEHLGRLEEQELRKAVGVHIRNRTLSQDIKDVNFNQEYGEEAAATMQHWREQSSYRNFIVEMQRIIDEEDSNAKFFVATDTKEVIPIIQEKFPDRILFVPRDCDDRDSECAKFAMIDLYALSRTKRLLGSNWSSYTELAERLGGLKAQLAGQDFGENLRTQQKSSGGEAPGKEVIVQNGPTAENQTTQQVPMFDPGRE